MRRNTRGDWVQQGGDYTGSVWFFAVDGKVGLCWVVRRLYSHPVDDGAFRYLLRKLAEAGEDVTMRSDHEKALES